MRCLIQRVTSASVDVAGERIAQIGGGLLVLAAVQPGDTAERISRMAERLVGYRVFADASGRMNHSVADAGGALLLVSQFTLAADTRKGRRPSFATAAEPALAERLFADFVEAVRSRHPAVQTGRFGADMQLALVNDGPVTFLLEG